MYRRILRFLLFSALCLSLGLTLGAQANRTYAASNVKELLKAIGSDRTIVLRKGDYVLDSGADFSSDAVQWLDSDDGRKELELHGLRNLTIRGAEGTRFVSESSLSYLLGVYSCENLSFDNIDFVRTVGEDEDVGAGLLYVESTEGLTIGRSSFSGPSGYPIEIWECSELRIEGTSFSGSLSGGLYGGYVQGLAVVDTQFSGLQGWPLLYFEESDYLSFEDCVFSDNWGSNFIELWSEGGWVEEAAFRGCEFSGNEFDWFVGSEALPTTEECAFSGNSFDEDWAEWSVAPLGGDEYYGEGYAEDAGPPLYWNESSMLAFYYPEWWTIEEDYEADRAVVSSPDEEVMVWFAKAYDLPANADPAKQASRLFSAAAAAFSKSIKTELGITLSLKESLAPAADDYGLYTGEYAGSASRSGGSKSSARVKFAVSEGAIWALAAFASDGSLLEADTDVDWLFSTLEYSPL